MKTYTYSEARRNLDVLFKEASEAGAVGIRRRDGILYRLEPVCPNTSPFSGIQGIDTGITRAEIVECVREGRELPR